MVDHAALALAGPGQQHLLDDGGQGVGFALDGATQRVAAQRAEADLAHHRHFVGLQPEDAVPKSCVPWSEVLPSGQAPAVDVIEQDPVYILHTSGSTGIPKLILHTHHSAMSFVDWAVAEYGITREDRLTNASSHHTCFATFDYYAAARAGAATVILTPSVLMMPSSLAALLERERVSVWYSVPTALVQL